MSLGSFGNNGLPQAAIQQALPNIPASAVSQTTNGSAAAGQSNVTLSAVTGVAIGQAIVVLNPSDGVRAPTTGNGIAGQVVTLSNTIYDTLPSGPTIYFLTGGVSCKVEDTMGAMPANRIATVNGDNKTIALSQALTAPLPKGSPVRACQAQVTAGGDLVPNSSISVASTTGVASGMIGVLGAPSWPLNSAGIGSLPQLPVP